MKTLRGMFHVLLNNKFQCHICQMNVSKCASLHNDLTHFVNFYTKYTAERVSQQCFLFQKVTLS